LFFGFFFFTFWWVWFWFGSVFFIRFGFSVSGLWNQNQTEPNIFLNFLIGFFHSSIFSVFFYCLSLIDFSIFLLNLIWSYKPPNQVRLDQNKRCAPLLLSSSCLQWCLHRSCFGEVLKVVNLVSLDYNIYFVKPFVFFFHMFTLQAFTMNSYQWLNME